MTDQQHHEKELLPNALGKTTEYPGGPEESRAYEGSCILPVCSKGRLGMTHRCYQDPKLFSLAPSVHAAVESNPSRKTAVWESLFSKLQLVLAFIIPVLKLATLENP